MEVWSLLVLTSYIHRRRKSQASEFFAGGLDLKKIFIPCSCIFHVGLVKGKGMYVQLLILMCMGVTVAIVMISQDIIGVCYRSCSSA
jgi:hypothetical protein